LFQVKINQQPGRVSRFGATVVLWLKYFWVRLFPVVWELFIHAKAQRQPNAVGGSPDLRQLARKEEVILNHCGANGFDIKYFPVEGFGYLRKLPITLLCLLFLFGCQPSQPKGQTTVGDVQVRVARVANGQTLEVVGMGQQPTLISQVRLVGIDAPDIRQFPWGDDAKEKLNQLIGENRSVILEFDLKAQDEFNRVLAYVWVNNTLLNEQLVKEGYVLFSPRSPNQKYDQRLERAQQWARLMGVGIWNPNKPMRLTPSEFRQINK
jgi:micrococcal nuclease